MKTDQSKKYEEENQNSDFIGPLIVLPPTHDTHFHVDVDLKSKFYKKREATFFYDITRKLGLLDFTQYRSKSSSF